MGRGIAPSLQVPPPGEGTAFSFTLPHLAGGLCLLCPGKRRGSRVGSRCGWRLRWVQRQLPGRSPGLSNPGGPQGRPRCPGNRAQVPPPRWPCPQPCSPRSLAPCPAWREEKAERGRGQMSRLGATRSLPHTLPISLPHTPVGLGSLSTAVWSARGRPATVGLDGGRAARARLLARNLPAAGRGNRPPLPTRKGPAASGLPGPPISTSGSLHAPGSGGERVPAWGWGSSVHPHPRGGSAPTQARRAPSVR